MSCPLSLACANLRVASTQMNTPPDKSHTTCESVVGFRMWLDDLPRDVLVRTALYLTAGQQTFQGLQLARSSSAMKSAVLASLNNQVSVLQDERSLGWLELYPENVVSAEIEVPSLPSHALQLLASSPLQRMKLTFKHSQFDDLENIPPIESLAPKLDHLTLVVAAKRPHILDSVLRFLKNAKQLKSLALVVSSYGFHESIGYTLGSLSYEVAACCRKLHTLYHNDLIGIYNNEEEILAWCCMVEDMPSLSQVSLQINPPEHLIPRLLQLNSVRLARGAATLKNATLLTTRVVEFDGTRSGPMSAENLRQLRDCTRLEVLHLNLQKEAEEELPLLFATLHSLREVGLRGSKYHAPKFGLLLQSVRSLPDLSSLSLSKLNVRTSELVDILQILGCRLRRFTMPLQYPTNAHREQLKLVIQTIWTHNLDLLHFALENGPTCKRLFPHYVNKEIHPSGVPSHFEVVVWFRELQKRLPQLDIGCFAPLIRDVVEL